MSSRSSNTPFSPALSGPENPDPSAAGVLTPFEAEIVAVFADLVTLLGLPKSMGEIYGLIFSSPESLAFVDIEQKLRLSKGSVSQGLRSLRELGAIQGVGGDGERRERWVATVELRQLIGTILRDRLVPYLERQDQRLAHADELLGRDMPANLTPAQARILRGRMDKLQAWQSRARTVLPLMGKML